MEHPNVALVRQLVVGVHRRLDGGPEEREGDPMADDVVVHFDPGGNHALAGDYVGIEGRRHLTGLLSSMSNGTVRPVVHDVVGGDGWAAMSFTITASAAGSPFSWLATSEFRIDGGRIVEDWIRPVPRSAVEAFCARATARRPSEVQTREEPI